ncbi:MAG: DUF1329 domain-containing protein [Porticoccaceae bacterium]
MHIKKYDHDYGRRHFMEKTAKGAMGAGVLTSLWPLIGNTGDITKAYPEELLSIDAYTKGKVKTGDYVDASNVELVKELLDPVIYVQISQMGRRIKIVPTTTEISKLYPKDFLDASLKNQGKAALDADGNVVVKDTGEAWIGGMPFPDPQTALEGFSNLTLSWGRHDTSLFAVDSKSIDNKGNLAYEYDLYWVEQNTTGLVSDPNGLTTKPGSEHLLRNQTALFTYPNDVKGTAFLSIWDYDQRKFPDLYGYLPAFKRVRRFPTNQRFEPLVPGMTFFLSDAWGAGDPALTWGNYKVVGRQPMLGSQSDTWQGDKENWDKDDTLHGGPQDKSFFATSFEFCPEVVIYEAEPVGYPRAPISKKRAYIDVRNNVYIGYITYDRRGEIWRSFEAGFTQQTKGDLVRTDKRGNPEWSWSYVHSMDIQTGFMTRFNHAEKTRSGLKEGFDTTVDESQEDIYNKYLTVQAIRRLGT